MPCSHSRLSRLLNLLHHPIPLAHSPHTHSNPVLREDPPSTPPERLLQAIWHHQRLRRDHLFLTDGRRIEILHPGFWNRHAGPDFQNAVLRIGHDSILQGDVEIDIESRGWFQHRHHLNARYDRVQIHVIWAGPVPESFPLPTLVLQGLLDSPWEHLDVWMRSGLPPDLPAHMAGRCQISLQGMSETEQKKLFLESARARFLWKAARIQARAKAAGWEQSLWEGLFRALGYRSNTWPMQCLAELRSFILAETGNNPRVIEARLFGLSGLLLAQPPRPRIRKSIHLHLQTAHAAQNHWRTLWDLWWRDRDALFPRILPPQVWCLHGCRPANHPHRRLALAAAWLGQPNWINQLEEWLTQNIDASKPYVPAQALLQRLQPPPHPHWQHHWTLHGTSVRHPIALLGHSRLTDLATNVILPWLWIRATEGKNDSLASQILHLYERWPASGDNSILKLARQRILGTSRTPGFLHSAAAQQGMLQIVHDFCGHSNALCEQCPLPGLLEEP